MANVLKSLIIPHKLTPAHNLRTQAYAQATVHFARLANFAKSHNNTLDATIMLHFKALNPQATMLNVLLLLKTVFSKIPEDIVLRPTMNCQKLNLPSF